MTAVVGELSYNRNDIIGKGGFGNIVYRGVYLSRSVAIKRMQRTYDEDEYVIRREVYLMRKAHDHPNILSYIHTEMNDDFLFIATELCRGTLQEYVEGTYNGPKFESDSEILFEITQGLAHLHKEKILHRDIKPNNILIFVPDGTGTKPIIKLADFGISKMLKADKNDFTNTSMTNPNGTKGWMPAEVYKEKRLDFKVDVWALGCIFAYTLCEGKHPFGEDVNKRIDLIRKEKAMLVNRKDEKRPHKWDFQAFAVIKSMLRTEPAKRPTVEDVLNHPFFIPYEDRGEYFEQLRSSFKDSVKSDKKVQPRFIWSQVWYDSDFENAPLHTLCRYYKYDNLIDFVTLLIEKGADVNAENANGETPLHLFCEYYGKYNMKAIVQLLIENGADVNAKNEDGNTPLHSFCKNGFESNQNFNRKDIFQLLIENGADVNAVGHNGKIAVHLLFGNHKKNDDLVDIVKLLIQKNVDVNAKDEDGDTPLHALCFWYENDNLIDLIQLLIDNGARVNSKNEEGETALHYLCELCYENDNAIKEEENLRRLVGLFEKHGASINEKDGMGRTPNDYLNRRENSINILPEEPTNRPEAVDVLSNHIIKDEATRQILFENICGLLIKDSSITADGIAQLVELLRDDSIDVNVKLEYGYTPLHILCAFYQNHKLIDFVQILIEGGADVNVKDKFGCTPLHYLCSEYSNDNLIDIVQLLIENGAIANAKNKSGETPLLQLCINYTNDYLINIVQFFIDKGVDVKDENENGWTPLMVLCSFNRNNNNLTEIAQLMIKSGADAKAANRNKITSLHFLCFNYQKGASVNAKLTEVAQLLIENGADVNAKDRIGRTPLHGVCLKYKNEHPFDIVQFLITKGADVNARDRVRWTPLNLLCFKNNNENLIRIVQLLITSGAEVNTKLDGITPLHSLCYTYKNENLIDIVQLLIRNGAEVNAKDRRYGWTPLHSLCRAYNNDNLIDIVQLLIRNYAEVNTKTTADDTPLHFLCRYYANDKLIDIAQLLIKNGVVINAKNVNGDTPLHIFFQFNEFAIKGGDNLKNAVYSLFEKNGVRMDERNNKGTTPNDHLICRKINVLAVNHPEVKKGKSENRVQLKMGNGKWEMDKN